MYNVAIVTMMLVVQTIVVGQGLTDLSLTELRSML